MESLIAPPRKPDRNRAPTHLSADSRRFWERVVEGYRLEDHHLRMLQAALEAWDRMTQARKLLAAAGPIYTDRFGAPRKHPAVSVEENARIQFFRGIRELGLNEEP